MGMIKLFSSCDNDDHKNIYTTIEESQPKRKSYTSNDPDPKRFTLEKTLEVGTFVIVLIHYPNCTNYEGRKIIVFKDVTVENLRNLKSIDPHFCDKCKISPIARFEPTDRGWEFAIKMCTTLSR